MKKNIRRFLVGIIVMHHGFPQIRSKSIWQTDLGDYFEKNKPHSQVLSPTRLPLAP